MCLPLEELTREDEEEERHRLLGLVEEAAADLVIIVRHHLWTRHMRPPTVWLARAILKTQAALTALQGILPDQEG